MFTVCFQNQNRNEFDIFNEYVLFFARVSGLVDGIKFSAEKILSLSGDQTLRGTITLGAKVKVKALNVPKGVVNGYDLKALVDTLASRNYLKILERITISVE